MVLARSRKTQLLGTRSTQDFVERPPEVAHGARVYDRVHSRVDVAEPRKDWKENVGPRHAVGLADRVQDICNKERDPAYTEDSHDDAQCFRRFLLFGDFAQFAADCELLLPPSACVARGGVVRGWER